MKINWEQVAEQNGLTIEEFTSELFLCVAALGVEELNKNDSDIMKFTYNDSQGEIVVTVARNITNENQTI